MIKYIIQHRTYWYPDTTIGNISIDDKLFAYTLEDTIRPYGIKVYRHTGIPECEVGYKVAIKYSNHFDRHVLVLYTHISNGKYIIKQNGISFTNVYAHGGNTHVDTDGCILVAKHSFHNKIYETMETKLFTLVSKWIKKGIEVRWIIHNN